MALLEAVSRSQLPLLSFDATANILFPLQVRQEVNLIADSVLVGLGSCSVLGSGGLRLSDCLVCLSVDVSGPCLCLVLLIVSPR